MGIEDATRGNYLKGKNPSHQNFPAYAAKTIGCAIAGTASLKTLGWEFSLEKTAEAFKKLDDFTGLSKLFPGAHAEAVFQQPETSPAADFASDSLNSEVTASALWDQYSPCNLSKTPCEVGSNVWNWISSSMTENPWVYDMGGVVGTACVVNWGLRTRIRNPYLRNALAFGSGIALTWACSNYGLGRSVTVTQLTNLAINAVVVNKALQRVAPLAQWSLAQVHTALNYARWDLSPQRPSVKL